MSVRRLNELQPASDAVSENEGRWETATSSIRGVPDFPKDYKELIEEYGSACFGKFIWILNPFSVNTNIRLDSQTRICRDALRTLVDDFGEQMPYAIDTLVPWFVTDNGDVGYWIVEGACENWKTAVNESSGERWFETDTSTVDFLCDLLAGTVKLPFFPADFPMTCDGPPTLE